MQERLDDEITTWTQVINQETVGTRKYDPTNPGICLIVPQWDDGLPKQSDVSAILSDHTIASIRLTLPPGRTGDPQSMADFLLLATDRYETSVLIDSRLDLVLPLGLHGVHLQDGARSVARARRKLSKDYTVGAFCGASRDEAYQAGADGADYVSFGPLVASKKNASQIATPEFFDLWSSTTMLPVLAEPCCDGATVAAYSVHSDYIVIGEELWRSEDPSQELTKLLSEPNKAQLTAH